MTATAGPSHPGPADPYALAESLVAASRWEAALDAIAPLLAAQPDDPRGLALLVRTLRGLGRRQEAVDAAQKLITAAPNEAYSYRLSTLVLLDVGWVDEAIGLAGRAVFLGPTTSANHLALARAWAQSPRRESVERQLVSAREAVMLDPNSPDAQVQLGVALAGQGDAAAARAAYRSALAIDPQHRAALNNLAVLELRGGDTGKAARGLAAALAADPQGVAARRNLDVVAIRMLRRAGWWALLAPLPALATSAAGWVALARVLAVIALVVPPLLGLRRWRVLAPGQRQYLRQLPRRVRPSTFLWPTIAAGMGAIVLARAWFAEPVGWLLVAGYLGVLAYMAVTRVLLVIARGGWSNFAADARIWWQRLRRSG